jgi:hypothetical protein
MKRTNKNFILRLEARLYSTINDNNNVKPAVVYPNADTHRKEIMEENRGKSGVYRWINLLSNKSYMKRTILNSGILQAPILWKRDGGLNTIKYSTKALTEINP